MDEKLIPAHVLFARWFIRIRWFAIGIIAIATFMFYRFFNIPIQEIPLYFLSVTLLSLNWIHSYSLKWIGMKESGKALVWIKRQIQFQIITDLIILTLIIHFSGGIENPIIIFYFFHMIIASSIFSTFASYLYASIALILLASLAFLECYEVIPHYTLGGLAYHDLYQNKFYIYGGGAVYVSTSILLVSLIHLIITKSIRIEETYVKTNLELEKKDKLQNEYVIRVTHDIKGHLAAIVSCLGVLKNSKIGSLNETQEEFINRAYERTELLVNFVKELLNLTRKRQRQDVEFEDFSIESLINKLVSSFQILAKEKSIEFNVLIDPSVKRIIGNPSAIEELYSNLLMNAVKYTPVNGHIELIVRNRLEYLMTEVSDTGIGILKDDIPKIFEEFYRGSNVTKDTKSGTGLGLSISKQIVENHHGRIWVSSEPGIWTRFSFILPKNPNIPIWEKSGKKTLIP